MPNQCILIGCIFAKLGLYEVYGS